MKYKFYNGAVMDRVVDLQTSNRVTDLQIEQNPRQLSGRTLTDLLISGNVQMAILEMGVSVTAWFPVLISYLGLVCFTEQSLRFAM